MIMLLIDEVKKCESSYEIFSKPVVLNRDLYIFWRIGDEDGQ